MPPFQVTCFPVASMYPYSARSTVVSKMTPIRMFVNLHCSLLLLILLDPRGPSTHALRTLGPLWVPNTINKDYVDP